MHFTRIIYVKFHIFLICPNSELGSAVRLTRYPNEMMTWRLYYSISLKISLFRKSIFLHYHSSKIFKIIFKLNDSQIFKFTHRFLKY